MEHFDSDAITRWASGIEPWKAVAFMAACAERMLPNYRRFVADTGFGDERALREGLDAGWSWAATGSLPSDAAALAEACERSTPDTEQHSSVYTSAALDAAVSITLMLAAVRDLEPQRAAEVASLARDSVDLWVQEVRNLNPEAPDFEDQILADDLMQAELRNQRRSIEHLSHVGRPRQELVASLKEQWYNREVGSLGDRVG